MTEVDFERKMSEYETNQHNLVEFYKNLNNASVKIIEIDTMGKKLDDIYRIAKDQIF